jgi:hypothetical protein
MENPRKQGFSIGLKWVCVGVLLRAACRGPHPLFPSYSYLRAMPTPVGKSPLYLCTCTVSKCNRSTEIDPNTKETIQGQFLRVRTTWIAHQELQQEADVALQTESLANMTFLRTMASTTAIAREVAPTPIAEESESPPASQQPGNPNTINPAVDHATPDEKGYPDPRIIERNTHDLLHLGRTIEQRISAFAPPQELKFVSAPDPQTPYVSQFRTNAPGNAGQYGLASNRHPDNASITGFESWMIQALDGLNAIDHCGVQSLREKKSQCTDKVIAMLRRLDNIRKAEWERQQMVPQDRIPRNVSSEGPVKVDTRECQ